MGSNCEFVGNDLTKKSYVVTITLPILSKLFIIKYFNRKIFFRFIRIAFAKNKFYIKNIRTSTQMEYVRFKKNYEKAFCVIATAGCI